MQLDSTSPPCRQGQASFQTPRSPRSSRGSNCSNASERGASSNESAFHESKRSKNSKDRLFPVRFTPTFWERTVFLLRTCPFSSNFPAARSISTSFDFSIPAIFPTFSRHFLGFRCGTGWRCRGNQLFSTNGRLKESLFQIPGDPWQNETSGRSPGRSPDPASVREVVYIL